MKIRWLGAGLALALLAGGARAAEVQKLTDGAYVLIGTSGNVLIVPGPDGALIVDDQRESDVAETLAGIAQVSKGPVRYVIDSHWHLDHCGGNEAFAKAGAVIVAHYNVRVRRSTDQYMAAYDKHIPAAPEAALPAIVYDQKLELYIGAETAQLLHVPEAHTDGDTIVKLKNANVIHMGDVFFNGIFPFIDRSSGGDIAGMIRGVDAALAMADDATRIVPAHGPVTDKAGLIAYRAMLEDVLGKVQAGIAAGKSLDQLRATKPTADYDLEGDGDRFVAAIYDSLMAE